MKSFLRNLIKRNKTALAGVFVLILFFLSAIFASEIAPFDPQKTSNETLQPPSARHFFGTDDLGRDIFSGVVFGARTSLAVGISVSLLSGLIGVIVGAAAGYAGGALDDFLMRVTELFLVPPRFFLALVFAALFGSSLFYLILILTFTYWTTTARLVRAEVLSLKERSYVEAARALGASPARILRREILPNAFPIIITKLMLVIGRVIILQAGLEFIGVGDTSRINWGYMLYNGQQFIRDAWWMIVFPSLALALLVLAVNIVADAINAALNPQTKALSFEKTL